MKQMKIYVDQDGVLAKYRKEAFRGPFPLYMKTEKRYFLTCEPDNHMLGILEKLNDHYDVKILTRVTEIGSVALCHIRDKWEWLQKYCPYIREEQFMPTILSKPEAVKREGVILTPHHILIDDYNHNLMEWNNAGGTGVKYLNDINSPDSYHGLNLDQSMTPDDVVELLRLITV